MSLRVRTGENDTGKATHHHNQQTNTIMVYNMAESKGGSFTRVVRKKAGRAKERILQNLGKADRTTDELFEVYQNNFIKQQNSATRLQKELKSYVNCVRAMQTANKALMDCLIDIYEPDWPGHDQIVAKSHSLEILWEEICYKLNDQVTIPLSTYLSQFSEIRAKMDKRGRKLVDFDGCRHSLEALQSGTKKKDEIKIAKAREQMDESKRLYEVLNKELHDELPALYDSRIPFLISTLQTFFSSESRFHSEYSKIHSQYSDIIDALALEAQKGTYHMSARTITLPSSINKPGMNASPVMQNKLMALPMNVSGGSNLRPYEEIDYQHKELKQQQRLSDISQSNGEARHLKPNVDDKAEGSGSGAQMTSNAVTATTTTSTSKRSGAQVEIPASATRTDLPPGVLYKVRATYRYVPEDIDELDFEVGEIISVIDFEDPEECEEGWLLGIKESTGRKALFPANFTKPI